MATKRDVRSVDLNTASIENLTELLRIDEKTAQSLIEHRPYKNWDDLMDIPGFSKETIDDLRGRNATLVETTPERSRGGNEDELDALEDPGLARAAHGRREQRAAERPSGEATHSKRESRRGAHSRPHRTR